VSLGTAVAGVPGFEGSGALLTDESEAPAAWILSDPAGNRVCIAVWPDGADRQLTPDR
jgi:4a-hydroxytetrahydrobiopterin dehydratase